MKSRALTLVSATILAGGLLTGLLAESGAAGATGSPWAPGTIFVAVAGDRIQGDVGYVEAVAPNGSTSDVYFGEPYDVTTDAAGDVFVPDCNNGNVTEELAGGGSRVVISGLLCPDSVALDNSGNLLVGSFTTNEHLLSVPLGGGSPTALPVAGTPAGIAVDSQNDIYFTDGSIDPFVHVDVPGATTSESLPLGENVAPLALRLDSAGDLYYATTFGGDPWSLTAIASHELAEMMRDPFAQWWVDRGAFEEALELCDRCEGYSFPLGGFEMADFLMAAALDPTATVGPWDYMLKLAGKEDVSPQGYVITRSSAFAPSVGAFLKASVRGGPQWRKRRWKTKTTVGRPGKRLGLYAKGKRCPVCFVPLSNADHAKRPCSVPGGPRMTAKGTAPTSRGPQDALSLVRKATTAAAQLARKVADPVIRRP